MSEIANNMSGGQKISSPAYTPTFDAHNNTSSTERKSDQNIAVASGNPQAFTATLLKYKLLDLYSQFSSNLHFIEQFIEQDPEKAAKWLYPTVFQSVKTYIDHMFLFQDLFKNRINSLKAGCQTIKHLISLLEDEASTLRNDNSNKDFLENYYQKLQIYRAYLVNSKSDNLDRIEWGLENGIYIESLEILDDIKKDYSDLQPLIVLLDSLIKQITPLLSDRLLQYWNYVEFPRGGIDKKNNTVAMIVKLDNFIKSYQNKCNEFKQLLSDELENPNLHTELRTLLSVRLEEIECDIYMTDVLLDCDNKKIREQSKLYYRDRNYKLIIKENTPEAKRQAKQQGLILVDYERIHNNTPDSSLSLFNTIYKREKLLKQRQVEVNSILSYSKTLTSSPVDQGNKKQLDNKAEQEPVNANFTAATTSSDEEQSYTTTSSSSSSNEVQNYTTTTTTTTNTSSSSSDKEQSSRTTSSRSSDEGHSSTATSSTSPAADNSTANSSANSNEESNSTTMKAKDQVTTNVTATIEAFRRENAQKLEEYQRKLKENQRIKQEKRRQFLNSLGNTPQTNYKILDSMRHNLNSKLDLTDLQYLLGIFNKDKDFDPKNIPAILKKLGFNARPGDNNKIIYSFGDIGWTYDKAHPKDIKSGNLEIPFGAIGNLKKVFENQLGITKALLLHMQTEKALKGKFIDKADSKSNKKS